VRILHEFVTELADVSHTRPKHASYGVARMAIDFSDDRQLVTALRVGDEGAFAWLLDRYHAPLHRAARTYVATDAHADEVVQETWVAVLRGIDRFEHRSALKTWLYGILMNIARTRGVKESRTIPFSSAAGALHDGAEPTFEADRFRPPTDPDWPGHWVSFPLDWEHEPETRLLANETLSLVVTVIDALPPAQREVITLRDIDGWTSAEVCNALGLSETNQRVLLHRGRARVRRALESHFESSLTA
jgi:RNA polymerase sigma-70 factor, ECF subfamily